jgi:hypothetical protein
VFTQLRARRKEARLEQNSVFVKPRLGGWIRPILRICAETFQVAKIRLLTKRGVIVYESRHVCVTY